MFGPSLMFGDNSSKFWNDEDPAEWSSDQIRQLTTDSPWAKSVTAEVKAYSPLSAGESSGGGRRSGGGRGGREGSASNPSATAPRFQGVVRWMTAKPIMLALKFKLPASLEHYYVIGVSGLPVISGHGEGADGAESFDALKQVTYLQVKGQESAQPGIIEQDPDDTSTILFGFLHQFLDLSKGKTAIFTTSMGPLNVKVKFDLARMTYKGELSV